MEAEIENSGKQKFYDDIVNLTRIRAHKECEGVLLTDSESIVNTITGNFQEYVRIAALNGRTTAYLLLYAVNSRLNDIVPIHDFIQMSEKIKTKFEEFNIEPVVDRITKIVYPFKLQIRNLRDCEEFSFLKTEIDIMVISVTWGV